MLSTFFNIKRGIKIIIKIETFCNLYINFREEEDKRKEEDIEKERKERDKRRRRNNPIWDNIR